MKSADDFYYAERNVRRLQRHSWCKVCVVADNRRRRDARRDHARMLGRKHARLKRLRRHGLTPETYAAMLVEHGGVCAICGLPETVQQPYRIDGDESLAIDHDHVTGHVRGLLCMKCNTAIGKLNDDPTLLRRAAEYLEERGCPATWRQRDIP